jgi:lipopolysaccharide/colanic/teichoic acid biosynthesis glycosyltransferase
MQLLKLLRGPFDRHLARERALLTPAVDLAVAGVGLVVAALPMLLIALTIKLEDRDAPILFRRRRVGGYGERFELLKW